MQTRRDLTKAVAIVFLVLWALLTHSHANSWNDASRLATVEALVHYGTLAVEDTAFSRLTGDLIFWNGHFYPDKPPVLSALAAGVYAILYRVFGLSLVPEFCEPLSSPCYCFALLCSRSPDWAYYLLTLATVGLPSALMLAVFYRGTALCDLPNLPALLVTGALGLGTLVLPYSLVFNNHLPTAAALMIGLYGLLRSRSGGPSSMRWLAVAGFATALAFTFDLLVVPFLPLFLGAAWVRHRRRVWAFLVGSLMPLALLAALDWCALGDVLPPSMHPAGFDYPGSPFPTTPTGNTPPADVLDHGVEMLFGERGLFSLSPVLLWSIWGLWSLLRRRDHWLWIEAAAVTVASLAVALALILFTPGFGGISYGTRWLLDVTPVSFFFAARPGLYRPQWRRLAFSTLAAFSLFAAWQGALSPWGVALPPFRLIQYAVSPLGRYLENLPGAPVTYTTLPRARYLPVHPVHAWHTSLRGFDVASGVLPAGDPEHPAVYVLRADERATRELLEAAFPQGGWELTADGFAIYRVPPGPDHIRPARPLQAEFGGQIRLLGCDLSPAPLRPGGTLTVRLYWQALTPMRQGYTAFVHLLGPPNPSTGGPLWAQDDHEPGRTTYPTDHWLPGEIVLDSFQLVIPAGAPPGPYELATGFYELATLQRLKRTDTQGCDTAPLAPITIAP